MICKVKQGKITVNEIACKVERKLRAMKIQGYSSNCN